MKNLISLAFILGFVIPALADESLGRFKFHEIYLSPRLRLQEPGIGGFELEQSWLGFEWSRDQKFRGVLAVGSGDLIKPAIWYPYIQKELALTEAWIEIRSPYVDLRAGLIQIPLGFEGAYPEWNSILPESSIRRAGWIPKRDQGLQLRFEAKPWLNVLTIHNGESGENKDRWMWASGLWQLKNSEGLGALLTASVGHTRKDSTGTSNLATDAGFNFNPNESAKFRYGILSIFREDRRNLFLLEAGRGEVIQDSSRSPFGWGRADLSWNFFDDVNLVLRYESQQADLNASASKSSSGGLGFVFSSSDNLQSLTFYGSHHQEPLEIQNDQFWLIFRLHSSLLH